ncbi:hypothetical protein PR202_ga03859 [Eleusine coracana subsp. coracana]|uniref:Uncharacterized protein n=1 Tax=Eleusine coracana subsp. coracana TaxID=191504 RepID=A0AAV5BQG3_ELECO|nr:hypothetical protein PR202_ga03859 [Eleusine coracana subsp. coracana]
MSGGDGERDAFFHCLDRVPSGLHLDADFPSDDDDEDVRVSFASAMGDQNAQSFRRYQTAVLDDDDDEEEAEDPSKSAPPTCPGPRRGGYRRRRRRHQPRRRQQALRAPAPALAPAAKAITRRRSDSSLAAARDGGAPKPLRRVRSLPARHAVGDIARFEKPAALSATTARELPIVPLPASSSVEDRSCDGDGPNKSQGKDVVVAASKDDASSSTTQSGVLGLEEIEKFIGNTPIVKHLVRARAQPAPLRAAAAFAARHRGGAPAPKAEKHAGKKKGAGGSRTEDQVRRHRFHSTTRTPPTAKSSATSTTTAAANQCCGGVRRANAAASFVIRATQEIQAHEGSIWSIKFSTDGRRLASAGEDHVVRVVAGRGDQRSPPKPPGAGRLPRAAAATAGVVGAGGGRGMSKKSVKGKSGRDALPEHLVVPDKMFALPEQPACVLEGHNDDVLDLTWSKSDQLLSSSMDKTVRLWDTEKQVCLKTFTHSDYVTCIHFNPVDDRYFISGSLDAKVRLWSIPNRQVVDWTDLNEMVTAASYTPDGQGAIVGSHKGSCRLYKTTDCKLTQEAQIDIQNKKRSSKSQEKKITGFQFASANPSEVLVTSADSQIRVFDGVTMVQKFRGYKNTSSQITAAYTSDGRYAVCASEDSHVYLWRTARVAPASAAIGIGMKPKTWCTIRSYENFYCKDVSAAVPWPHTPSPPGAGGDSPSSSRDKQGGGVSCNEESCSMASHGKPADGGGKSGELSSSGAPLTHSGELGRHGGGVKGDGGNAWGLVVVAASLGGEIRVYQNFGMPFRIRGQGNLFG